MWKKERKEIETILYVFLRFKDSSIFFIHKRNFRRKRWLDYLRPQQEVFIPFKKRSCLARSELLHLESIKWIKFHQWSGHSTFVFLSLLFLLDCWQLLLLSTSSKSSTLWNCSRTRGDRGGENWKSTRKFTRGKHKTAKKAETWRIYYKREE